MLDAVTNSVQLLVNNTVHRLTGKFLAELGAGIWADSKALMADSADNLGDSLVYAISLFVVARSVHWRAGAAVVKGLIQLAFRQGLIVTIIASLLGEPQPIGLAMMAVAGVALVGNLFAPDC